MRIAKNDTVHAIWLKLSKMQRFIVFLHGFHRHGYARTVLSGKLCAVSGFVSSLTFLRARWVTDQWRERQRYHE
jgi:hypothetical protein